MPWQQHVADVALEVLPDGRLRYSRVVVTVPRQSGKTLLILPVMIHRSVAEFPGGELDVGPQRQAISYTAQTRTMAKKKWQREFIPLLEKSPFRNSFSVRLNNGQEGMDWANGSTFDLTATTEKAGHGDTLDLGVIDEAFAHPDDRVEQAMDPATITRVSPQIWIPSTAGENEIKSPYLWSYVQSGREIVSTGADSDVAYFEWSVPDDEDHDDIEVVARYHPAFGHTVTMAKLKAAYAKAERRNEMAGFYRAYCNQWGTVPGHKAAKVPTEAWSACPRRSSAPAGRIVVGWDVDIDGSSASIAVAGGNIGDPYVELVEHRTGTGWLAARLVELVERHDPIAVGFNNAGPSAAQASVVLEAFKAAGISADVLAPLGTSDYAAACGGLFVDIAEGRLTVADVKPGPLDLAVGDVSDRRVGEGWAWDRRSATVPISPLVAVTVARALLPTEAPAEKHVYAY